MVEKPKKIIGRADRIDLPEYDLSSVPIKVDTGAKTSAIWATNIHKQGRKLAFTLFGPSSPFYTGKEHVVDSYERVVVASSIGVEQPRYKITLLIKMRGKKIRAGFTLADRTQQAYPVLIGRNALRGKFVVDVQSGRPDYQSEKTRHKQLQSEQE